MLNAQSTAKGHIRTIDEEEEGDKKKRHNNDQ